VSGVFEPLDAGLQLGDLFFQSAMAFFERSNAPVELCVGKSDHGVGLGSALIDFCFDSIAVTIEFFVEAHESLGHEIESLLLTFDRGVEMATRLFVSRDALLA
jgi:hypothetical protein